MDESPTVAEFVDYCELNAGLLAGRAETIGSQAAALLDEVDDALADAREGLDAGETDLDELEGDLAETQTLVEAKQARMKAFQALAAAYTDLAEELESLDDASAALERVVEFEQEHDAPTYFDERETLLETVAKR